MTGKNKTTRIVAIVLTIVLASAVVLPAQVASAATITVNSTSDGTGGPNCTLRDAITAANTDTATGDCPAGSGADTIVLAKKAIYTLTEVDNSTYGPNGLPAINSEITLEGHGSIIERSGTNGTPEFRIIHVAMGGNLTLNEVNIFNGRTSNEPGGGIYNKGVLMMNDTTVNGNEARGGGGIFNDASGSMVIDNSIISYNIELFTPPVGFAGGGIRNDGTATITDSVIRNNNAQSGGGIYNIWDGILTLINSTVSNNSAASRAGGIGNVGVMTLINTTISGNTAGEMGGGIYSIGVVTLTNSTISDNSAGVHGGGIYNYPGEGGTVELTNTIVAAQRSDADCYGDSVTSLGYNLDSDGSCSLSAPGDLSGFDPLLGPLADNGGPTWTHALLPGSPAIDGVPISSCSVSTDQRGVSRPQGVACDIGAFEVEYKGPVYTITDLGTLNGPRSSSQAINDNGQITGDSTTDSGDTHAFLWEKGNMIDLGTLGGNNSDPRALNNSGQIVGSSYMAPGTSEYPHRFFLWDKNAMTDLGVDGDDISPSGNTINNAGQIIGRYENDSGDEVSFLWEKGSITTLGTLGGCCTIVSAINEAGQIVGSSYTASGEEHAFLWDKGTMIDLGTLGGPVSGARVINEVGQIAGISLTASGEWHAFLWDKGTMIDLGLDGAYQLGITQINNRGQIIGSISPEYGVWHAFLWENGNIIDLGTLGGSRTYAIDINERGQIVGNSYTASGDFHAFLWDKNTLIDLGTLGGDRSYASDINERGQIVGSSNLLNGDTHAVLWEIDH